MSQLPLKVGVVGTGIGRLHIRGYQALSPDEVTVAAVCDIDASRVAQVATEYTIPLQFTDYQEMFQSGKV
ncbi:MAG: Gfo/Idh/MocA family oxidoreductase, partial [Okeania sp. SIO3B3]|nr:Gfo/Idh/MocA family oxidoreductase [Okeania sp. SIO3B3]